MSHANIPFPWPVKQIPPTPQELSYLEGCGADRTLERARWALLHFARQHGLGLQEARRALLHAHIQEEARRVTQEIDRLQALAEYAVRTDIPPDETNYLSMSPEEFRVLEQRLRARARGVSHCGPANL